ncbi:LysR substrate-binding domain-containing protein [Azospirillum thermophilum]|uniref:LysR family transcriptional regulator n=1 Tax=Azospirillum thermophilum TaxID=2202148 RepID=A0A2S2CQG8_9PROT|nr:LysR substrate-binding domain-containing protein [Azospirillum thermophilum]AWK86620.1 LysR family transcriptional regulator [Azospirillum thermophilum]
MRFDLTDLRLFLHVVEAASITHGAERSHLALASASARIRGMEEALGVPLLERGRRGVRPTPAGRALVHHARMVTEQLERMRGELGAYARGLKGHVRVMSNTAALTEFLPELLGSFLAANPSVDIDLQERLSYEIVQAVAEGLTDIGIVSDSADPADLQVFPFRTDAMVLVVPRDHPLAGHRQIAFREVMGAEFVGLSTGSAFQDHLDQHAARAGRPLKMRVRLRSFEAVCRMVEQGVGIAVVSETAARRCRRTMALWTVRLTDPWAKRALTIAVRRFDALPLHAQRLVEHLRAPEAAASRPSHAPPAQPA